MGDRAGYRVRDGDEVSNLIRKRWQIDDIKELVTGVARTLLNSYGELAKIGSVVNTGWCGGAKRSFCF